MHLLEPFNANLSFPITRAEPVAKKLVYLPFNHLMQLLVRVSLTEQFNLWKPTGNFTYHKV
jgi:hypothetical protein